MLLLPDSPDLWNVICGGWELCFVAFRSYSKEVISLADLNLLNHQQIGKHVPYKRQVTLFPSQAERGRVSPTTEGDWNMEIHFGLGLNQHPVESAKNRKVLFGLSSALGQSVHIGQERKCVEIVTRPLPVTQMVHISHTRIQFSFFWQLFAPLSRGVSFCCTPEELNGCWMDWNGMESAGRAAAAVCDCNIK